MADFEITEKQVKSYSSAGFNQVYDLEAGGKLSDDATLIAIANKTVPTGYKVKVEVSITIMEIEKL